jgi:Carboxypeptidase regulatory-like domain
MRMRMSFRATAAFLAGLTLFVAGTINAQETKQEKKEAATERVVEGTVADPDGKFIDGAVVQLKDMRTLQVRSFYTQKNGGYHFSGLKLDNDYELEATYNAMRSGWKRLSVYDTRKVPVINLKLEKAKPETKP